MAQELSLVARAESFPFRQPFCISGHVFTSSELVVVEISDGDVRGRGEAAGVYYLGDDVRAMLAAIEEVRADIAHGATRADLQTLLPPGGARNALDCAFWDLESKQARRPVWKLAGMPRPKALRTTITIGADTPESMAHTALGLETATALKLKLTGELEADGRRVEAVRAARPDCWLGVDANQGFSAADLRSLMQLLVEQKVRLLEQPLARGREADLDGVERLLPVAADESCVSLAEVEALAGRFDVVNIKLDKCGGLTEGLALAARARALGLQLMVGNMMGTSLSMAPSFVLGQLCEIVDLDGPTFLASDRSPAVEYREGTIWCPEHVWGWTSETDFLSD